LLDKAERRLQPVRVKYVGFQIPNEFVVGYGLDYAEDYRNFRDIRIFSENDTCLEEQKPLAEKQKIH